MRAGTCMHFGWPGLAWHAVVPGKTAQRAQRPDIETDASSDETEREADGERRHGEEERERERLGADGSRVI